MMYLAPRQGLFAIIVLVSFCLQTLLLVISTDQQLSKSRTQKGEQMVAQLIDEARLALENQDRVSLSVIANRYTSEQDVTRILIKDSSGELLVPVGNAPMQQGNTISQIATKDDAVIGSVALTLKDISKGEIITMQWPFVIGSMLLHLLLWLLYGYVARPTKEQINALSREIQDLHREQYPLIDQRTRRREDIEAPIDERLAPNAAASNTTAQSTTLSTANDDTSTLNGMNVHSELNAYLKAQQNPDAVTDVPVAADEQANLISDSAQGVTSSQTVTDSTTTPSPMLSPTRSFDSVNVRIMLHDDYNMLERLAPEMRMPYLALCTQLLNQALTQLLKQPLLLGVSAVNEPVFDEHGAHAILKADNSHAKVALAGVMLAKLYLMLNKIIHDKHIELSRFALPAKAGVSSSDQGEAVTQLLQSVGKKEQLLILLPNTGLRQISSYVQVRHLEHPTTVYERECAIFDGGSEAMMQRLADVRNTVLMIEEE